MKIQQNDLFNENTNCLQCPWCVRLCSIYYVLVTLLGGFEFLEVSGKKRFDFFIELFFFSKFSLFKIRVYKFLGLFKKLGKMDKILCIHFLLFGCWKDSKIPLVFCIIFYLPTQYSFLFYEEYVLYDSSFIIWIPTKSKIYLFYRLRAYSYENTRFIHKDRQMAVKGLGEIWTYTLFP